jgi:hypothetical protein
MHHTTYLITTMTLIMSIIYNKERSIRYVDANHVLCVYVRIIKCCVYYYGRDTMRNVAEHSYNVIKHGTAWLKCNKTLRNVKWKCPKFKHVFPIRYCNVWQQRGKNVVERGRTKYNVGFNIRRIYLIKRSNT